MLAITTNLSETVLLGSIFVVLICVWRRTEGAIEEIIKKFCNIVTNSGLKGLDAVWKTQLHGLVCLEASIKPDKKLANEANYAMAA